MSGIRSALNRCRGYLRSIQSQSSDTARVSGVIVYAMMELYIGYMDQLSVPMTPII